jgi:hypothetical protein
MKKLAIWIFCILYLLVSFVSTIHIIEFFELSNSHWLSVTLGVAFELGSAASLLAIAALEKSNKYIIWGLFVVLTLFQIQANTWNVFAHVHDYKAWVDLFWLNNSDEITQKRVLGLVAGSILPIVALGFVKSLVDYMKPGSSVSNESVGTFGEGTLDHVPTDEEIQAAIERNKVKEEPIIPSRNTFVGNEPMQHNTVQPVPSLSELFEQKELVQEPVDLEIAEPEQDVVSDVDLQTLRDREAAAQLVSEPTPIETQIDNKVANPPQPSAPVISSDTRIARGMQIKP